MNKNTFLAILVILVIYLTLALCEAGDSNSEHLVNGESRDLTENERRIRRRHGLHHLWGWPAGLAIAYWVKVKLVIVSFFVGSAVFLGLRYFWPHKCGHDFSGPVYLDHPPSYANHDHTPYHALDHSEHIDHSYADASSYDSSSFEPYSSYVPPTSDAGPPISAGRSLTKTRKTRSLKNEFRQNRRPEEQIAEFMFVILGVDSSACRRRFICEMEFRSRENPLTSMAFRIIGRGFFSKYTNSRNSAGQANSFEECAAVNPECVFIEQNVDDENASQEEEVEIVTEGDAKPNAETSHDSTDENQQNEIEAAEINSNLETVNSNNLNAERRYKSYRERGDRKMQTIFDRIMMPRN